MTGRQPGPALSVVVPTDRYDSIHHLLASLRAQSVRDRLEIVLVTASASALGPDGGACAGLHSVTVVEVADIYPFFQARAQGIRAAHAPIVLLGQGHAYLEPHHCEIVIRAHEGPWAAVGPALFNANPATITSWLALYMDHGSSVEPGHGGVVDHLPGVSSSYKRALLLEYGDGLESMMRSTERRHSDLRARGHQLYLEPAAKAFLLNVSQPWTLVNERLITGRGYAGARAAHWSRRRRLAYAIAFPLIPLVRLPRILRGMRGALGPGLILRGLPVLGLSLVAGAVGEGVGYAFGMGDALRRANEMELHRERYVRPGERGPRKGAVSAASSGPR
jgi:hypothetical protein